MVAVVLVLQAHQQFVILSTQLAVVTNHLVEVAILLGFVLRLLCQLILKFLDLKQVSSAVLFAFNRVLVSFSGQSVPVVLVQPN